MGQYITTLYPIKKYISDDPVFSLVSKQFGTAESEIDGVNIYANIFSIDFVPAGETCISCSMTFRIKVDYINMKCSKKNKSISIKYQRDGKMYFFNLIIESEDQVLII
jgi:hypothetical protein